MRGAIEGRSVCHTIKLMFQTRRDNLAQHVAHGLVNLVSNTWHTA